MFEFDVAWWELMLRALVVYVALLVMVRLSGKRTVGQFSPFDLIVVLLLGEAVAGSLTGGDESMPGGLLVVAVLMTLNAVAEAATAYSKKVEKVLEGSEVLLGRNGRIFENVLKSNLITRSAVEAALRQADVPLEEMDAAILEADGTISILRKK